MIQLSLITRLARPPGTITGGGRQRETRALSANLSLFLQQRQRCFRTFQVLRLINTKSLSAIPSITGTLIASSSRGTRSSGISMSQYRSLAAMGDSIVQKRGRGFETSTVEKSYKKGDVDENALRLGRPTFPDEEPDFEDEIVLERKPKKTLAPKQNTYNRTGTNISPQDSSGGVKLEIPTTTPIAPALASTSAEAEKPRVRKIKPGHDLFVPTCRMKSVASEAQPQNSMSVGQESTTGNAGISSTGMDFSRMTKRSLPVQTMREWAQKSHQGLKSQSIGSDHKSNQQANPTNPTDPSTLHQGSKSQSVRGRSRGRPGRQPADPHAYPKAVSHTAAQSKASRQTPASTEVLVAALKSLPPSAPQTATPTNTVKATPEVASSPLKEYSQLNETSIEISSDISTVIESVGSLKSEESSINTTETISGLDSEEISTDTHDELLFEASIPYQLGSDEKFASESSDESESVTSTIRDYDEISEKFSDEEAASGEDGIAQVKKTRSKPKPIETSDGKIYYPVSVGEEPYVPLSYNISTTELNRLLALKEGSKLRVWSHNLYSHEKEITVECCSTLEEIETAAQKFLNEKAVGFDMEWLPRPSKHVWDNVSLIQVAKEDYIALFHLARIKKKNVEELIPPSLKQIIESKDILKLGVQIGGDGSRIKKWLGIEPQGLMELSSIHHVLEYARERRRGQIPRVLVALSKLCEQYLQLPISKGTVRISDWTKPLSPMQISYAATDAYAGLRIYDELQKARMLIDPMPMLPSCVKCSEESKKRRVVTPKLYVDGVEQGTSGISTWDTQITVEAKIEGMVIEKPLDELNWADEVEQSTVAESAPTPKNKQKRKRKTAAKKLDANEIADEETVQKGTGARRKKPTDGNEVGNDAGPINKRKSQKRKAAHANEVGNVEWNEGTAQKASGAHEKAADNSNQVKGKKKAAPKSNLPPQSPQLQSATDWANLYQEQHPMSRLRELKAYSLWQHEGLSVEEAAIELGIEPKTAAQYILRAVWADKLPYDLESYQQMKSQYPQYRRQGYRNT